MRRRRHNKEVGKDEKGKKEQEDKKDKKGEETRHERQREKIREKHLQVLAQHLKVKASARVKGKRKRRGGKAGKANQSNPKAGSRFALGIGLLA